MSALTDRFRDRRRAATPGAPAAPAPPAAHAELRARRDALAEEVAELTWDLGGLTYEMAIRDHFRLDVLIRRAAALQERDAELGEVERLLAAADAGRRRRLQVLRRPPQPRRRLLLEVRPAADAAGGERGADRAAGQRQRALGLPPRPAAPRRQGIEGRRSRRRDRWPRSARAGANDGERRFLPAWRAFLVARRAGAPRRGGLVKPGA